MTKNQINLSTSIFFFLSGKFWQKSNNFINLILIYCKIKEDQGEEEALEDVTFTDGVKLMLGMWEILGHSSPIPLS